MGKHTLFAISGANVAQMDCHTEKGDLTIEFMKLTTHNVAMIGTETKNTKNNKSNTSTNICHEYWTWELAHLPVLPKVPILAR